MLRPFLIIGVGGSGGKTLRAVRSALDMKLRLSGWNHGLPAAWQFLHFDTPLAQDGKEFPAPFLPQDSYVGLSAAHGSYSNVATAIEAQVGTALARIAGRKLDSAENYNRAVAANKAAKPGPKKPSRWG